MHVPDQAERFFILCAFDFLILYSPRFGIAHALCLGMGPWLAAEIPHLVDCGAIRPKEAPAQPRREDENK